MSATTALSLFRDLLQNNGTFAVLNRMSDVVAFLLISLVFLFSLAGAAISGMLVRPTFYLGNRKSKHLAKKLPDYNGSFGIKKTRKDGLGNPKVNVYLFCGKNCENIYFEYFV